MSCSPTPEKKMKISLNVFRVGDLEIYFMPILKLLIDQKPESSPFLDPVDPIALNVPTYFDIIKTPMDLSTIKKKLETGLYHDPWEFVDDVWLMFNNAWTFNNKNNIVFKYCTKLAELFGPEIDRVMKMLGYCCGRSYSFLAQALCCCGKDSCIIPRDAKYFVHPDSRAFCVKCFDELPEYSDLEVVLEDHTYCKTSTELVRRSVRKSLWVEATNDEITPESFVNCVSCKRKLHQICVLHMDCIWPDGYTCTNCLEIMKTTRAANMYNAEGLRKTKLGDHIEQRVNRFLNKQMSGVKVTVRVLSSLSKIVQVKEGMKVRFVDTGKMSATFPYICKAIFAFEEIDGVDVCFFGMHVQEYGSESPPPNTRRVYISYLDSVQLFYPYFLRTPVYHEILLGYLEYVKKLGYSMAHIWACPPQNGDDYIFHGHPPKQKIPSAKRLLEWYKKMLKKGIYEHIVVNYENIFEQARDNKISSVSELPYFDGDFWSDKLEDLAQEIDQSKAGKPSNSVATACTPANSPCLEIKFEKLSPKEQKVAKKKWHRLTASDDLTANFFSFMKDYHEDFLVVHLQSKETKSTIQDPDPFIVCDLMDGRDSFLLMAKEKHFDFSSLRRSKYGTMVMLFEIHNLAQQEHEYVCNKCRMKIKIRFHCTVCEDFDLCVDCKKKFVHSHKMTKLAADGDRVDVPVAKVGPTLLTRDLVANFVQMLIHASECNDVCRVEQCRILKYLIHHISRPCPKRREGGCNKCSQFMIIIYSHAKNCNNRYCPVRGCYNLKLKMYQKAQDIELMNNPIWRQKLRQMMQLAFDSVSSEANVNVHPATAQNTFIQVHNFPLTPSDVKHPMNPPP